MSEIDVAEAEMLMIPIIRDEVERLAKALPKLSMASFVALTIAMRRESERRIAPPPRPVGIGNR